MGIFPLCNHFNDYYKEIPIGQWGRILVTVMRFAPSWPSQNIWTLSKPLVKFGHSEKATKISHLIWHLLSKRQIKWEIVSNFVAFLKNLNCKCNKKVSKSSVWLFNWAAIVYIPTYLLFRFSNFQSKQLISLFFRYWVFKSWWKWIWWWGSGLSQVPWRSC